MKKVIDGEIYNTDTSTKIASYESGVPGEYLYISEALYKTDQGIYFTAGEGGAATVYRRVKGNGAFGQGEGIRPISEGEALNWCQSREIDADVIEAEFGDLVKEA